MPSTVAGLLKSVGLPHGGSVDWGMPVPSDRPGIYLISLSPDPRAFSRRIVTAPISSARCRELKARAPELAIDGKARPTVDAIASRLSLLWLPDETILYIGTAGGSIDKRVRQYYNTKLGARSPHSGGWPLKTLQNLRALSVHWAEIDEPEEVEAQCLAEFADSTSAESRTALIDRARPYPFANLTGPQGRVAHGISGARSGSASMPNRESESASSSDRSPTSPGKRPAGSAERVTLHKELADILRENANRWMTTVELAAAVARRGRYIKRDGTSDVSAFQVHGRTKNYSNLFERDASRVRLRIPSHH